MGFVPQVISILPILSEFENLVSRYKKQGFEIFAFSEIRVLFFRSYWSYPCSQILKIVF